MNTIHGTAIIDESAKLGKNNYIGPYCVIGPNVELGDNNRLESHVSIGSPGQYRAKECLGGVDIGNNNVIREFAQVHAAMDAGNATVIGNDCYLMTNSHVDHDCVLEDGVTLCTNATLGGTVYVMKGATLGFATTVHQIGRAHV